MTEMITPNKPSAKKKNLKRIFFGFVLIFLAVFSLAVAVYWPEFQKQFFPEMTAPARKNVVPVPASAPVVPVAPDRKGSVPKEGFLWVAPASSSPGDLAGQYVVTLGKAQGVLEGKQLKVYNGTDLLGQVVVDRALETVSYCVPETSLDLSRNNYYRVVAK